MTAAFANAFWVFIGIVAGALIQYGFNWLTSREQITYAKDIFRSEVSINLGAIARLKEDISRKKGANISKSSGSIR